MTAIDVALVLLVAAFLAALARVAWGPSVADRVIAADVCFFTVVATLALLSARNGTPWFLDAVLVATLLGFLASVSLARLIGRDRP